MAKRRTNSFRYGLLAVVISMVLWGIANQQSSVERGYDVPVAFYELPDDLVITGQNVQEVNVRVVGSRVALRNLSPTKMEYAVTVAGSKPGWAEYEVDVSQLDMPRGARIVSRSPAQIDVKFERRGRKNVRVRPDLEGEPAEGFSVGEVQVEPARVWLTGARSNVLRVNEVVTETIDLAGATEAVEREVKLSPGTEHVWMEEERPVKVRVAIEPVQPPEGQEVGAGANGENRANGEKEQKKG